MDDDFCKEGLINNYDSKDRDKIRKYWFITYYDEGLGTEESIEQIKDNLRFFPHLENYVFQIEQDKENRKHVHIAIGLNDKRSKPVRQFIKLSPDPIIYFIENIQGAQEYCSKKYSRLCEPVFFGLSDAQKDRLICLGKTDRPVKLMQKTTEREISTMIVKKTNIAFSDNKEVEALISKVKASLVKEDKITLLNKASEKLKLLSHTLESANLNLSHEIGAILDVLISKEKKVIHKKDKELVKKTTTKMTQLVKVKDKVYKQVEQDTKFNIDGLEFLHSKKKQLEEERRISQDKKVSKIERDIVKLEECIKICSNVVDNNSSKLEQLDKTSPISLSPTLDILKPNKESITKLDDHLCTQKSKKLPIKVIKKKEDYF